MDYLESTDLYRRWHHRTQQGEPNDYVIAVTASSKTGVSGSGKTTVLTGLGEQLDTTKQGFDAEEKATLDVGQLAYERLPDIETLSAVVVDEAQGAPGTTGFDRRRGMVTEVIDAINAILANRDKQLTIILGAQTLQMLDQRLYPIIDSWLLIRYGPDHPQGPRLTHHLVYVEDYDLQSPTVKTPALEDLTWPRVPHDNPNYETLTRMKQEAKRRRQSGEDGTPGEIPKPIRDEKIKELYKQGVTQPVLADSFGLDQSQISRIVNS